jgi:membrane protein YdbS with pleckstrin-like domain
MAFPKRLLIPGEDVVVELRPHWAALVVAGAVAVLATVAAIWITVVVHVTAVRWIVWAAWIAVILWGFVRRLVWWLTSNFVVTTNRVIHRQGFIAKRSMEIPLDKINDVRFEQGMLDRIIGAGTLIIQSASEAGRNDFDFVRDPEGVQKTIYESTQRGAERLAAGVPAAAPSSPPVPPPPAVPPGAPRSAPNVTTELERLADLRARGVLTEEEFQAQKARILGQR